MSSARRGTSARGKASSAFTSGGSARPTSSSRPNASARQSTTSARQNASTRPTTSSRPNTSSTRPNTSSSRTGSKAKAERRRSGDHVGPSKPAPQQSLMELVHKRFVDDVFLSAARVHPGWKVLIVDEPGMKVISAAVGMYDIMEQQVSIVESLEKKRAPFKDMAAIYVLAPSNDSVKRLLNDFADKSKVLYGKAVFLYFLGPVPKNLMNELKQCKQLVKRLKAVAEVNIDFLIKEARAFTLDVNDPFASLYRGSGVESTAAEKLVTLCATLNEYPYIRYSQNSRVCSSLASVFKRKMDQFVGSNPAWWYHGSGKCPGNLVERDRSTVLLLDRSSDCLTPLMHDFTYQAMVNDLLTVIGDKITYKAESQDNPKAKENKDVLLNDKDKLWVEMRGEHIAKVIEVLSGRIQDVVNSSTSNVARKKEGNMSLAQLASALKELPEYREVMSKLSQHMHIAHECMDQFNRAGLYDLSDIEQTLATGKDEDGKATKLPDTISRCESMMLRINDMKDRLRLMLIATISQDGLSSSDKDRLLRAAQFGRKELQTLESLTQIGISTVNNKGNGSSNQTKSGGFLGSLRNRSSSMDSFDEESEYANSRYVPPLKKTLQDLVSNQLSIDEYPSVIPMPPMSMSSSTTASSARRRGKGSAESSSSRKKGATDKWGKKQSKGSGSSHYDGGRNIVFMVGGLSFAELRVARDVMERESREIIAGGTKFISPAEFIDDLKTLTEY